MDNPPSMRIGNRLADLLEDAEEAPALAVI
jgi:hypothetical protein